MGFKDDFELRAMRSIAPEEVVEELDFVVGPDLDRIAVDPGAMFLVGGAKTLLGSTFLAWARDNEATALVTFSVDGGTTSLPSSADWLVNATTARLLLEKRSDGLFQITVAHAAPRPGQNEETVSLELKPGGGLVQPTRYPARRDVDRGGVDENRLLLVCLGGERSADLEAWSDQAFETDIVTEPVEAVARVQRDAGYGGVLIHTARRRSKEALQTCRALRPLTRAAIVLASDDAVRSTDRIRVLEAGADDFLSGGLDFRELGLRIRQAVARGTTPALGGLDPVLTDTALIPADSDGGRVSMETFRSEVERRATSPDQAFFCVLDVRSGNASPDDVGRACAESVRSDEGDLVSAAPGRCAVLLQGAREAQLGPFLARLRSRLSESGDGIEIDVLSHPAEADRIMAVLGSNGATVA